MHEAFLRSAAYRCLDPNHREVTVSHEMFLGEDFYRHADNVYEAIIAIARRARQIGEEQRKEMDAYLSQVEMLDKFQEEEEGYEEPVRPHEPVLQFEKPTILALREMVAGKLELIRNLPEGEEEKLEGASEPPMGAAKIDLGGEDEEAPSFGGKLSLEE
jgi:DNA-directed RNA polymerase subunit K/omega